MCHTARPAFVVRVVSVGEVSLTLGGYWPLVMRIRPRPVLLERGIGDADHKPGWLRERICTHDALCA